MTRTAVHTEHPLIEMSPFGKDHRSVLVFPEPYSIASSNLAFHQIYRILGQHPSWSCERAVVESNQKVLTLETGKPLEEFDLVAFTVPFELGYLNVIKALDDCPIQLYADERTDEDPLIAMGGIAAAANPAVMAPFVDIFLLGEGEASLPPLLDLLAKRRNDGYTRLSILEEAAQVPGAYVPIIHGEQPSPIRYARVEDMDEFPPCSAWLTSETEFDNTFLFEISRGCPCGCRFCMIRLSQKPLRAVAVHRILELVDRLPREIPSGRGEETVRPKVGLVGAAVASHPDFEEICRRLREKGWGITASAIEIDKVTDGMLDLLSESQKTLTLAPERGIEAERYRLGKQISDDHLLQVAQRASELGMPRLKMYFVGGLVAPEFYGSDTDRPGAEVNLPDWLKGLEGEDYHDAIFHHEAEAVANLVERIAEVFQPKGKTGTIGVTCSPFIPKPHTPWAGWPMAPENGLKRLDKILKKRLGKIPRARYRTFSGWEAHLQGLLSQGDQRLAPTLVEMTRNPEKIRPLVREAIKEGIVDLLNRRWVDGPSPWEFVKL
ncbi:MAG: hypothetical protein KC994_16925 [Candidatus Omnitrophica bacterium]|nr:hypothetical protein [Candidatus Omnitrophota bacterium]